MTTIEPETRPDTRLFQELREQTLLLVDQLEGPIRRVSLAAGTCTVEVEWDSEQIPTAASTAAARAGAPAPTGLPTTGAGDDGDAPIRITAPLVGTFYRASQPGADPFVKVGDLVSPGQTLAIVEAMKLMNPITAQDRAQITTIHPVDGEIVEYDQPLFDLAPVTDEN